MAAAALTDVPRSSEEWRAFLQKRVAGFGRTLAAFVLGLDLLVHAAVDARSDLHAVGAVAYYLLTGTHVFEAETIVEVCSHHLHTEPEPPSQRAEGVPRGSDDLAEQGWKANVAKAIEGRAKLVKRPSERPGPVEIDLEARA